MWQAVGSILALVVVAALNIAAVKLLNTAADPAVAQITSTAIWALQVPLAALFVQWRAGRSERAVAQEMLIDARGASAAALAVLHACYVFVAIQLCSALFGAGLLYKDIIISSLCAQGDAGRCAQVPADALGATVSGILIGGGGFALLIGLVLCGVLAYRMRWRARRWALAGALATPFLAALLLWLENVAALTAAGSVDATIDKVGIWGLLLPRLAFGVAGAVAAAVGFIAAGRVNRAARRYAFSLRRASRRSPLPVAALKEEFLGMLGFSAATHELVVRPRAARPTEAEGGA